MGGRSSKRGGGLDEPEKTATGTKSSVAARLNVNINEETAEQLRRLANRRGISYTETIRRAVAVLSFVEDEREAGNVVQSVDETRGVSKELVLLG